MDENHDGSKDGAGENAMKSVDQVTGGKAKTKRKWPFSSERAHMLIEIVLDAEGGGTPLVGVSIDGCHAGYINSTNDNRIPAQESVTHGTDNDNSGNASVSKNNNRGIFEIECSRRGNRRWQSHRIYVTPTSDDDEFAFFPLGFLFRFNPTNINYRHQPLEVRIPIKLKRNWRYLFLTKVRPPYGG